MANIKVKIALAGVVVLWLVGPFMYHVGQRVVHWASKPPKTICVQDHTDWIMQTTTTYDGKSTHVYTHMVPIVTCDKEVPNPKYAEDIAKWRGNK